MLCWRHFGDIYSFSTTTTTTTGLNKGRRKKLVKEADASLSLFQKKETKWGLGHKEKREFLAVNRIFESLDETNSRNQNRNELNSCQRNFSTRWVLFIHFLSLSLPSERTNSMRTLHYFKTMRKLQITKRTHLTDSTKKRTDEHSTKTESSVHSKFEMALITDRIYNWLPNANN